MNQINTDQNLTSAIALIPKQTSTSKSQQGLLSEMQQSPASDLNKRLSTLNQVATSSIYNFRKRQPENHHESPIKKQVTNNKKIQQNSNEIMIKDVTTNISNWHIIGKVVIVKEIAKGLKSDAYSFIIIVVVVAIRTTVIR